jgi:hypothetical protein
MAVTMLPAGFVVRSLPLPKDFDPLTASDQELLGHGLPRRPKDPRLLSDWESLVRGFARSTFIEPEFLATIGNMAPCSERQVNLQFRNSTQPACRAQTCITTAHAGLVSMG